MKKKTTKAIKRETNGNIDFPNQKIELVPMNREVRKAFLEYSMSVIISRALPDVRDGMKPGQRRILYAMWEDGLTSDKPFRKSATTVGDVLGRYHPHGDSAVYGSMVRMAQDFSLRYPLIEGHGNFGSIDGDGAAAYRYTEARLAKISDEMMRDLRSDVVDMVPNFDNRRREPAVLPSRFPNLLVNGSVGIAVGMATNIPPHNLGEVIDGAIYLMENPDATVLELMELVKGPDFPTGAIIYGRQGIKDAYETGKGRVMVRARAEIDEEQQRILITEIPYMVNKSMLVASIADLVKDKRVEGITAIRDESGRDGMKIVIECRHDANLEFVLNHLYKYTQLEDTCAVNMLALDHNQPKVMGLRDILRCYIDHQDSVIKRRCEYELKNILHESHILEGYKLATDNIDEVISIIRASADIPAAKTNLMERFKGDGTPAIDIDTYDGLRSFASSADAGLSDEQADAIVKMPLGRLSGLEREKIEEKLTENEARAKELYSIIHDDEKIRAIVKEELLEIKRKYADDRRTEIVDSEEGVDDEDLIERFMSVVTLTNTGYIKRQRTEAFRAMGKGAQGHRGLSMKDEDVTEKLIVCDSHSLLLFFTSFGRMYAKKAYTIKETGKAAKGTPVVQLIELQEGEKITDILPVDSFEGEKYLIMITKYGVIKKTKLSEFERQRKGGKIAINLDEGDRLVYSGISDGTMDVFLATHSGKASRYSENDVRCVGRTSRGVAAIKFKAEDDYIVGATLINNDPEWIKTKTVITVTENGMGKRSSFDTYMRKQRPNMGVFCHDTEKAGGLVAGIAVADINQDIMMITDAGYVKRISVENIREVSSNKSKGVGIFRLPAEYKIVSVAVTEKEEEEEEEILEGEEITASDEAPEIEEASEETTEE